MGMVMVMMIKIMMVMDNDRDNNDYGDCGIDDYYGADCGLELLVNFFIAISTSIVFIIRRFQHYR